MIHFHFCESYKNKISVETDKVVRNRIANLERRNDFKEVQIVTVFDGVYMFLIAELCVIAQEQNVSIEDDNIAVFFIQDVVLAEDKEAVNKVKSGLWAGLYPISDADKSAFINDYTNNQLDKQDEQDKHANHIFWLGKLAMNATDSEEKTLAPFAPWFHIRHYHHADDIYQ